MSFTLEDFLEANKKEREKERETDLLKIRDMIESGVSSEINKVVEPLAQQQKRFETESNKRIANLEAEVVSIRSLLQERNVPTQNQTYANTCHQASLVTNAQGDKIKSNIAAAKKVIYLQPIYQREDVERQKRMYSTCDDSEAMRYAVREYLVDELKIPAEDIPPINRIFPPFNTLNYDRLYVEFHTEHAADLVASHARIIKKPDHHVGLYFPRMFQARFRALNKIAKSLREAPGLNKGDLKTKVVYGNDDIKLLSRSRDGRWASVAVDLSSLPPIQPDAQITSSSPPKGRNRRSPASNSKRPANSPLQSDSKQARGEHDSEDSENINQNTNEFGPIVEAPNTILHTNGDNRQPLSSSNSSSEPLNLAIPT